ncbi:MAG: GWxTD domain-containing protein, partial [Longimicrobiales bacterium]
LPFQVRTDFIRITSDTVLSAHTVQLNVKDMTFQNKEGIQHGLVNIFGRVSSLTGRIVSTFEDVVQIDVPAEQFSQYLNHSRVYWQGLPLRPGMYRLNLVLKDIVSGNMGTHTMAIRVPRFDEETLSASSLILADQIEKVSTKQIGKGQFVIGSTKVRPNVAERFNRTQRLGIYLQVYNLGTDEKSQKPSATVEYALLKDERPVFQFSENSDQIHGASQQMTLEKLLPLSSLEPGRYKLQVKVTDQINKQTITPTASFTVQ